MKRLALAATAIVSLAFAHQARAAFIDGWLSECTAVATGSCTELTGTGYARQPIGFSSPTNGVTVNSNPFTFGPAAGTIAGRGVYDAASGGHLLFVIPVATSIAAAASNPDRGDVGAIKFTIAAMANYPLAGAYIGTVAPAAVVGTSADGSSVSSGVAGTIYRGDGYTAARGIVDPNYDAETELTGFTVTPKVGASTLVINGAGTLATGTVTMPATPNDGQDFRLDCGVTVTALTVAPGAGQTLLGSRHDLRRQRGPRVVLQRRQYDLVPQPLTHAARSQS